VKNRQGKTAFDLLSMNLPPQRNKDSNTVGPLKPLESCVQLLRTTNHPLSEEVKDKAVQLNTCANQIRPNNNTNLQLEASLGIG
jgi:hypothetical protein